MSFEGDVRKETQNDQNIRGILSWKYITDKVRMEWLEGVNKVALTAGASAPECLVEEVTNFLATKGFKNVREIEVMPENVRFGLPMEIVDAISSAPVASSSGGVAPTE